MSKYFEEELKLLEEWVEKPKNVEEAQISPRMPNNGIIIE